MWCQQTQPLNLFVQHEPSSFLVLFYFVVFQNCSLFGLNGTVEIFPNRVQVGFILISNWIFMIKRLENFVRDSKNKSGCFKEILL